jgi:uncharacterized integral membrane protein
VKLPQRNSEQGLYALIAVAALVVIYLVAFVVQNATRVPVSFVAFETDMPLIGVILFGILAGLVVGVGLTRAFERRRRRPQGPSGSGNGPTAAS